MSRNHMGRRVQSDMVHNFAGDCRVHRKWSSACKVVIRNIQAAIDELVDLKDLWEDKAKEKPNG